MPWKRAKDFGRDFNNVVKEPLLLHQDGDLPYLMYLMFDPLHCIKGNLHFKKSVTNFITKMTHNGLKWILNTV